MLKFTKLWPFKLAMVAMAAATGSDMAAQAVGAWGQVVADTGATSDIRVKILSTSAGYQIYFKNFGPAPVHFGYYLEGSQTVASISKNGRFHLQPGAFARARILQIPSAAGAQMRVHLVGTVVGEEDLPVVSAH